MTRAFRLAVFPRRSHARSRMTKVEERRAVDEVAAGKARWRRSGVPVKAVAVATTRARRRAVMADFMVGVLCGVTKSGEGCVNEDRRTDDRLSVCQSNCGIQ